MSKKAFTLIELLVVVAVLALLASIVFSNLGGAREGARISNALSFQSQTHSLLGSDLVGWWNFNEGSGTTTRDISGYDNHGNIIGATYVEGVPGTGGTALSFNGVDDYIGISSEVGNFTTVATISVWAKTDREYPSDTTSTRYRGIISKNIGGSASNTSYWIDWTGKNDSRTLRMAMGDETTHGARNISGFNFDGKWHHLVLTWNREFVYGYVNGEEVIKSTQTTNAQILDTQFEIGRAFSSSSYSWEGDIDDVRIYNHALTAQEIKALYAQTKDKYLANE